jgi:hypothetical protein
MARNRNDSAGSVVKIGLIAYVLAALLNSSSLLSAARDMTPGSTARKIALPLARANNAISRLLHTTRLGERADEWRGNRRNETGEFGFTTPSTTLSAGPPTSNDPGDGAGPATTVPTLGTTAPPTTVPPTTTTTAFSLPIGRRPATPQDHMRVYVAGDSLVQGWGEALQRRLANSSVIDLPLVDSRPATGLMRPDKFDWPRRLETQMKARHPDVVIVGFGGNDGQRIELNRSIYDTADPEWQTEYRRRVASTLEFLQQEDRTVIWVGTPPAQNHVDSERQRVINDIVRDEVGKRRTAVFVDAWKIFGGEAGEYAAYMDIDGVSKLVRGGDGFHLNVAGAERLARDIYDAIANEVAARST